MGTMMNIRDAVAADLPKIVALLADDPLGRSREAAGDTLDDRYTTAFAAILEQWGNTVLVAVAGEGDAVAGCLQLTFITGLARSGMLRAQIEGVRVQRNVRGDGVGRLLVEEAIERARHAGCGLVQLTTDRSREDAHIFYERLGFVASHWGMKLALEP